MYSDGLRNSCKSRRTNLFSPFYSPPAPAAPKTATRVQIRGSTEPAVHRAVEVSWNEYIHPCIGNRTDALWCDDASTCFVGCGTTTNGQGMYTTADGGENWDSLTTSPLGSSMTCASTASQEAVMATYTSVAMALETTESSPWTVRAT